MNLPTIPAMTRDTVSSVPAHAIETDSLGDDTTSKAGCDVNARHVRKKKL